MRLEVRLRSSDNFINGDAISLFKMDTCRANLFVIKTIRNSKSTRHGNPIGRYNVSNIGNLINVGPAWLYDGGP